MGAFFPHFCLGAHHARLIIRSLLGKLCECVERIECIAARNYVESEAGYQRKVVTRRWW